MLYLLDKNVVEDIRGSLKGICLPGIHFARQIDHKRSIVSPLLAIVEGSLRRPQVSSEIYDNLVRDTQMVAMFYRQARTDAKALQQLGAEMIVTFGAHAREKIVRLMPLARELQTLLSRTFSLVDARTTLRDIDSLARTYSVELSHPLVTCAVACLYGHTGARKVLKPAIVPSEGDSYNALADVRMLMETAYIRRMWQQNRPWEKVFLHTGDKNLNDFAKILSVVAEGSILLKDLNQEFVTFKSTITEALFPDLRRDPKEMDRVLAYVRATRQDIQWTSV